MPHVVLVSEIDRASSEYVSVFRYCATILLVTGTTKDPYKFGPDVRSRYLDLIRAGHGRNSAARAVGINIETMRRYARASEDFRQELADAEEEAAEPVEAKLYAAALDGEPWAVKEWLTKRMRARWGEVARQVDVNVSGQVQLEAGPGLVAIEGLARELEQRRAALEAAGDVIDAESWEHEETPAMPALPPTT